MNTSMSLRERKFGWMFMLRWCWSMRLPELRHIWGTALEAEVLQAAYRSTWLRRLDLIFLVLTIIIVTGPMVRWTPSWLPELPLVVEMFVRIVAGVIVMVAVVSLLRLTMRPALRRRVRAELEARSQSSLDTNGSEAATMTNSEAQHD